MKDYRVEVTLAFSTSEVLEKAARFVAYDLLFFVMLFASSFVWDWRACALVGLAKALGYAERATE